MRNGDMTRESTIAADRRPVDRPPVPRDRFRGVLLGLAVGDALGAPAEFLTPVQVRDRWGVLDEMVGGGCHRVQPGEGTDATEMMLALAEGLMADDFDPSDVVGRYRAWFATGPRDVSLTTRTAMLALAAGTPWELASHRAYEILGSPTAGNGSVMRCAPVALRYFFDGDARRGVSLADSALTHFDHLAGWSCVALNELLVAAMAGRFEESLPAIAASLDAEDSRVSQALREATDAEPSEICAGAFVLDSLKAAVWAVLHTATFEGALVEIVNRGADAIPARWLEALLVRERATAAAAGLAVRATS